jgi:hypothetical protein
MWRRMVYGRWAGRALAIVLLGAVALESRGQPVPVTTGESGVTIEIRYKAENGTTLKVRRIPGDGFSVPNLAAAAYSHTEPCWNTSSPCVVAGVTVKTLYRLPAGLTANWSAWWCKVNGAGECPMPPFPAVTLKPGEQLCMTFDRVKAEWRSAPALCAAAPAAPPPVTPSALPAVSYADSYGVTWSLGALCAGSTTQRTVQANGAATPRCSDDLRLTGGLVYWRTAPDQGWQWTGRL